MAIWAAATGTLLVADAWFDVILESHSDELRISILSAALGELPAAALCFWIAYRAQEYLLHVVDAASGRDVDSHLPATGERPAEGDLVGVLEVTADGEAAGQTRDPDSVP